MSTILISDGSVQFIISAHEKKGTLRITAKKQSSPSLVSTTIVTNKIGVSIDYCTLTQKSKEKVGERKHTLYKLYTVIHTLF